MFCGHDFQAFPFFAKNLLILDPINPPKVELGPGNTKYPVISNQSSGALLFISVIKPIRTGKQAEITARYQALASRKPMIMPQNKNQAPTFKTRIVSVSQGLKSERKKVNENKLIAKARKIVISLFICSLHISFSPHLQAQRSQG